VSGSSSSSSSGAPGHCTSSANCPMTCFP
jgi:hypothetical protein